MHAGRSKKDKLAFLMFGPEIAHCIYGITKLSIPDIIADSLVSVDEIAEKSGTCRNALYRIMRMLAGYDIFNEKKTGYFENTELSSYLTKNHPDSYRDSVIYRIELSSISWNNILYSLKTGKPAFDKISGTSFYEYLAAHPEKSEIFDKAMVAQSRKTFHDVLEKYDFSSCNTLIDIGGGHGCFTGEFLKKYPQAKAVLFDLQIVLHEFDSSLYDPGILSRLSLQAGDFFESVPAGGDVYFLKTIIHDWNDEQAAEILKNISDKMKPNSRLLLVETIVPAENCRDYTFLLDLQMLVQNGGRERTKQEYEELFKNAGCVLNEIYDLPEIFKIIEAKPAK